MNRYLYLGLLSFFLLLGLYYRVDNITTNSSQIDDSAPAAMIIEAKEYDVREWINNKNLPNYNSKIVTKLRALDSIGVGKYLFPVINTYRRLFSVSWGTTFAPTQFFLTTALFVGSDNWTMRSYYFWSRLPSLFFDLSFIILMVTLLAKIVWVDEKKRQWFSLLAAFFWANSLESRIFANQAESYSIGLFAIALIFIWISKPRKSWKTGLFLGLLFSMQYAILPFIGAVFLFLVKDSIPHIFNRNTWFKAIKSALLKIKTEMIVFFCVFSAVFVLGGFFRFLGTTKLSWATGLDGEFWFPSVLGKGLWGIVSFFPRNVYIIICGLFSDVPLNSFSFNTFYFLLTVFFFLGLGCVFRLIKDRCFLIDNQIRLFILYAILCYASFVVLGMVTFSPTRHSLLLFPFIIIGISFGIFFVTDLFKRNSHVFLYGVLLVGFVYSLWGCYKIYPFVKESYTSPWIKGGEAYLRKEIGKNKAIVFSSTLHCYMLNKNFPNVTFARALFGSLEYDFVNGNCLGKTNRDLEKSIITYHKKDIVNYESLLKSDTLDLVFYNINPIDQKRILETKGFQSFLSRSVSWFSLSAPSDEVYYDYFEPCPGGRREFVKLTHFKLIRK